MLFSGFCVTLTAYGNSPIKTVFPIVPSNPFTKIAKVYYG